MTNFLIRRHRGTRREEGHDHRSRDQGDVATSQKYQGLPAATRSQESSLEGTLSVQKETTLLTPRTQTSGLQNWDNKFVILSPELWYLVMAAPGNQKRS